MRANFTWESREDLKQLLAAVMTKSLIKPYTPRSLGSEGDSASWTKEIDICHEHDRAMEPRSFASRKSLWELHLEELRVAAHTMPTLCWLTFLLKMYRL